MNQEGQEDQDYWADEYEGCDCEHCDGPQVWDDEEDEG